MARMNWSASRAQHLVPARDYDPILEHRSDAASWRAPLGRPPRKSQAQLRQEFYERAARTQTNRADPSPLLRP